MQSEEGQQSLGHHCRQRVALVVMDKDTYIEKCMTLLNEHKVYQDWRDLTKTIHNKVIKQLTDLK